MQRGVLQGVRKDEPRGQTPKALDLRANGLLTEDEFRTALLLHAQINGGAGTVLRDAGLRGEEASEGV